MRRSDVRGRGRNEMKCKAMHACVGDQIICIQPQQQAGTEELGVAAHARVV